MRTLRALAGLAIMCSGGALSAQQVELEVERSDGSRAPIPVRMDRGFAAVEADLFEQLGWTVRRDGRTIELAAADEITITLRDSSPFFRWDGVVLHLTDAPYLDRGRIYLPLQLVSDFLPRRLPGLYTYDGAESVLRAGDVTLLVNLPNPRGRSSSPSAEPTPPAPTAANSAEAVRSAGPTSYDGARVVIIDAGHGGEDPGSLSQSGIREKAVALAVALRLRDALRGTPDLEIVMIRDDDTFVELWQRGQIATEIKGERPGIFVSIHANSFPARRAARGFETYFLSDARTEHERRVSAIENAPMRMDAETVDEDQLEALDYILQDLINYDHAHWSENLAMLIQDELDEVHPGPNRGVKQGVLAVLTNALMPSVLVELGYLSNSEEADLMADEDFHQDAANALAEAVLRFFERYPPGSGGEPRPW